MVGGIKYCHKLTFVLLVLVINTLCEKSSVSELKFLFCLLVVASLTAGQYLNCSPQGWWASW